ncbi:putative transcriptional acitvator, Baf family [Emticicia oligotrophica DSM 17448]|uniref:Type III pantothenate kinase n=1 Tax=Emticicia oligotrophica (strain DSM 17448 / CIP 109782 / MTCC 6937 / GPTSA100-15) TaxID=929562 RepID=A0ABM5MZN1_EMTOG|nr:MULTISPECIES: type III pantothenate kinase [Emticicia]AFK02562.1 putative transcriptional acitvator, Baf family [Emticicia oligotrophica DSM 17448]
MTQNPAPITQNPSLLLVIDVGNTDATFGLFDGEKLLHNFRIKSLKDENYVYFEYRFRQYFLENNLRFSDITKVVLSSVVPPLTPVFKSLIINLFGIEPIVVNAHIFPALSVSIDNPDEIGSDLVANAVAAFTKYQRNCVVVDFGTALTFTIVSAEGKVLGVSIAPGLRTAVKALFSNTAQLPEVPLELPNSVLGKNSVHAIQAGILWGYEGLVKNMIHKIRAELGGDCIAIATGGLSSIISTLKEEFVEVNRELTLEGLRIIGEESH